MHCWMRSLRRRSTGSESAFLTALPAQKDTLPIADHIDASVSEFHGLRLLSMLAGRMSLGHA